MKPLLFATIASLATMPLVHAGYTFGTVTRSATTANITYSSSTGIFQYTDTSAATSVDDDAEFFLVNPATVGVTTSTGWNATLTPSFTAKSLKSIGTATPDVGMALGIEFTSGNTNYLVGVTLSQVNNTGSSNNTSYPPNFYGTSVQFVAQNSTTGANLTTTPLGASLTYEGVSYQNISGGTLPTATTKTISAVSGVLSFSYNATTKTVTGSYNGAPVGSYKLPSTVSSLAFGVYGFSGEGIAVAAGGATATSFSVAKSTTIAQTITFPAIPETSFGTAPFQLAAKASSGLPVTYTITTNPITVSATGTVTLGGTVTIQATQPGNAIYSAAPPVSQTFSVK